MPLWTTFTLRCVQWLKIWALVLYGKTLRLRGSEHRARLVYFSELLSCDPRGVQTREKEEEVMLIINENHRRRCGVASLDQRCPNCGIALREYLFIMSNEVKPSVYHAACAL